MDWIIGSKPRIERFYFLRERERERERNNITDNLIGKKNNFDTN